MKKLFNIKLLLVISLLILVIPLIGQKLMLQWVTVGLSGR